MKKIITALALAATLAVPAAVQTSNVQASAINDAAKQNTYSGVTSLQQILQQEGIKYNDFLAANQIKYRTGKPEGVVVHETA
ncbi:amidase, partial [Lactobacillus sp. XV13L]|nr:amidase [Lactobacillus sp. XV13L]